MVKFGRISNSDHQLCYAHGLHLAFCNVLYNKKNISKGAVTVSDRTDKYSKHESMAQIGICDSIESDDEKGDFTTALKFDNSDFDNCGQIIKLNEITDGIDNKTNINITSIVSKVRKTVRLFRKSPLKNEILKKYVHVEHGKELQLKLNCQTRWNSFLDILERFLILIKCIAKAMIDNKSSLDISENEFNAINDILLSLQPVKIGVEKLGRRDSTLLSAESVFSCILN